MIDNLFRLMAHSGVTEIFDYSEFLVLDEATMLKVPIILIAYCTAPFNIIVWCYVRLRCNGKWKSKFQRGSERTEECP